MKIIGQMVCGAGEADRWLEESLKEFKRLCDDAIICLCNATEKEKLLVQQYGFQWYEDNREWGVFQPEIKSSLIQRLRDAGADWILALDADECLPSVDVHTLVSIARNRISCQFYVVNLWNDVEHYSKALSFWNVRFYKLPSEGNQQFTRKPVHCGNAPPVAYAVPPAESYVPHILLHKGLMRKEDRLRKIERYNKYDPNAIHKGRQYYDALAMDGEGSPYVQEEVINKIKAFCENLKPKNTIKTAILMTEKKFYYVKRNDPKHLGSVVDIPADQIEFTLKNHPTWEILEDVEKQNPAPITVEDAPVSNPFQCVICGKVSGSLAGRKSHERIKHP